METKSTTDKVTYQMDASHEYANCYCAGKGFEFEK
jgi:hypothetical protein